MSFARCRVTLELVKPADGAIAVHLFKGTLIQPSSEKDPWFCLVEEVKLGLSSTFQTDAECTDPGVRGNIASMSLMAVAGYPRDALRVSNGPATGGAGDGGTEIVATPGTRLSTLTRDTRYDLDEEREVATLLRMNMEQLGVLGSDHEQLVYDVINRNMRNPVFLNMGARIALADLYATVARVVIVDDRKPDLPPLALGFYKTKLVFVSAGETVKLNSLPGQGRLFLPSESHRLFSG